MGCMGFSHGYGVVPEEAYSFPAFYVACGLQDLLIGANKSIAEVLKKAKQCPARYNLFCQKILSLLATRSCAERGGGGVMLNCHGTVLMIDPVLEGFDMPLLFEPPITAPQVPRLDGVLITHIDNDHFSVATCQHLMGVCKAYHATQYVAEVMRENGLPGTGHDIGGKFAVGPVNVTLTPAWHNWQKDSPDHQYREWKREDYCGYWLDTPDGTIWLPGDSRLLPEHLEMLAPDVILFDFSDNDWHIGLEGAVKLANAYPHAQLLCIHWGTVDAPEFSPFNANPEVLLDRVGTPERVLAAAPGQAVMMPAKDL